MHSLKERKGCGDRLSGDAAEYRAAALSETAEVVEIAFEAATRGNELA